MKKVKMTVELTDEQSVMLTELAKQSGLSRVERAKRMVTGVLNHQLQTRPVEFKPPRGCEKRYGKTARQLKNLFVKQGSKCSVCGATNRSYCVDHTEPGGQPFVRGIVCDPCNKILGYYRDVPDYLRDCIKTKTAPADACGTVRNLRVCIPTSLRQLGWLICEGRSGR